MVNKYKFLKKILLRMLNLFPGLSIRLKRIQVSTITFSLSDTTIEDFHSELNKDFDFIHSRLTHKREH